MEHRALGHSAILCRVLALALCGQLLLWVSSCASAGAKGAAEGPTTVNQVAEAASSGGENSSAALAASSSSAEGQDVDEVVVLETTKGNITIALFDKDCPRHADAFKKLVRSGFYAGVQFVRVFPGHFAQAEDPEKCGLEHYEIMEPGHRHVRGAVAAGRNDTHSLTCVFYVCMADMPEQDGKFTVFGEVIDGMDVVDRLQGGDADQKGRVSEELADKILKARVIPRGS